MSTAPLKIGIAGGGIAGLYCALKLGQQGHHVTLFEHLHRFGGRIESVALDGFKAECGPMRFECAVQPLFTHLARELSVPFAPFTPPKAEQTDYPKYHLRPQETYARGDNAGKNASSLDLLKFGVFRMFQRSAADQQLNVSDVTEGDNPATGGRSRIAAYADSLRDDDLHAIRTSVTLDGQPLHTLGIWNALARELSPEAMIKIRDVGTFYHLMPENPSASEWSIFWLRLFRSDATLSTVSDGVEVLVERILEKIARLRNVELITSASVRLVEYAQQDQMVHLTVGRSDGRLADIHLDFDHVILALPKAPMAALTRLFPADVCRYIAGVIGFPLLKAFLVTDKPWWPHGAPWKPQRGAHLLPTREVHYYESDDRSPTRRGMVMLYTDRPATAYWAPFIIEPHQQAQIAVPPTLRHELAERMYEMLLYLADESGDAAGSLKDIESHITTFAIRDWSRPPFGAASHAWAPGIVVPTALDRLKAFSLIGRPGRANLHICGEAYSDYQGFIEGALRSSESVIESIAMSTEVRHVGSSRAIAT